MAHSKIHSDPIFKIFKDKFKINLFYKPYNTDNDNHYHIILDSVIIIKLVLKGRNFIIIDDITPLTTSYIEKTYDTLLNSLINQEDFTVLIQRLGNTTVIKNACIRSNVPTIVDEKFITIPKKLYGMYKRFHEKDENNCGFYLLAVNSNMEDLPVEEETIIIEDIEEEIVEDVEETTSIDIEDLTIDKMLESLDRDNIVVYSDKDNTNNYILIYKGIIQMDLHYKASNNELHITGCGIIDNGRANAVDYLNLMILLENIDSYKVIIDSNVNNHFIKEICDARHYIGFNYTFGSNKKSYIVTKQK